MDGQRGLANLEEVSRPSVEGSVGGADEPLDSGWRDTSLLESDEEDSRGEVSGSILRFLLSDEGGLDESGLETMAPEPEPVLDDNAGAVEIAAARDDDDEEDLSSRLNKMCVRRV